MRATRDEAEMPICAYCNEDKELCDSHSIPDSIFRMILRNNNGKLVSIPLGEKDVQYSQDTGKAKILCRDCESLFNREFDGPLVNALKKWDRKIRQEGFGAIFEYCPSQLAQSLASIFWRASVSSAEMYKGAAISQRDRASLLRIVTGPRDDALTECSCSIHRLFDKTPSEDGGFSLDQITQIILPVTAYRIGWNGKPPKYFAFAVIMHGFLCIVVIPRLPHAKRNTPGYLRSGKLKQHAPALHFMDYPPLADAMVTGLRKQLDGKSRI